MDPSEAYPKHVEEILAEYGHIVIKNPMTDETAPLNEAVPRCVKEGVNHLVPILAEMSLEEAGVLINELAVED